MNIIDWFSRFVNPLPPVHHESTASVRGEYTPLTPNEPQDAYAGMPGRPDPDGFTAEEREEAKRFRIVAKIAKTVLFYHTEERVNGVWVPVVTQYVDPYGYTGPRSYQRNEEQAVAAIRDHVKYIVKARHRAAEAAALDGKVVWDGGVK